MPEPKTIRENFAAEPEPTVVRIPEGWFQMGCETGRDDEKPVRRVWVDALDMAAHQTTNEEYARFLSATGHRTPLNWNQPNFDLPDHPVVAPSWFDAAKYCEWLSQMTGRHYRLPTEAEWERAARGGMESKLYPWGDTPPETVPDYTNGARIFTPPTTTAHLPNRIRRGRSPVRGALRAADRGGTPSKFRGAPRVRVFLPNSNTRITGSAWLAT